MKSVAMEERRFGAMSHGTEGRKMWGDGAHGVETIGGLRWAIGGKVEHRSR